MTHSLKTNLDIVSLLQRELEREIKLTLTNKLTKKAVANFRAEIDPIIKNVVESVTVGGIESMRDLISLRDDYTLAINYNGDKL